jgi:hypothetical protein
MLIPPSQARAATTTPPTPDPCSSQATSVNTPPDEVGAGYDDRQFTRDMSLSRRQAGYWS